MRLHCCLLMPIVKIRVLLSLGLWKYACARAGDPNCIHIPGLTVDNGSTYTLVVSDVDDFDAVLPVSIVHSLIVRPPAAVNAAGRRPSLVLLLPRSVLILCHCGARAMCLLADRRSNSCSHVFYVCCVLCLLRQFPWDSTTCEQRPIALRRAALQCHMVTTCDELLCAVVWAAPAQGVH